MTKIKKTAVVLVVTAMLLFAGAVPSFAAPESGGAVLSQQDDKYVPLYTTAPTALLKIILPQAQQQREIMRYSTPKQLCLRL